MRFFSKTRHAAADTKSDPFFDAINASHAIAWFNAEGEVIDANTRFCEILGYTHEAILGLSHDELVFPCSRHTEDDRAFFDALEGRSETGQTVPRRTKDGDLVWLQTSYVVLRDRDGKPQKVALIANDVTEPVSARRHKLAQFDAIAASQSMIVYDVTGKIVEVNDGFLEMMGYRRDELVGKHHSAFVAPDEAKTDAYKAFLAEMLGGKLENNIVRRYRKDGSAMWMQGIFCPVYDAKGDLCRIVKLASDVTDREQVRNASEVISRVQAVIEFKPDGTVITANDHFLNALGYTLDEIEGKHHSLFMPKEEVSTPAYAAFWDDLRAGNFRIDEFRRRHKNGGDVWISASYNPVFNAKDEVIKVVKYATDITTRVRAVAALREALANLADGDLRHTIEEEFGADFAALKQDFNSAVTRLRDTVSAVVEATREIDANSGEIASASDDLSRRTESQAASLEETSAAVTEMAASVKSTADIAKRTNDLVGKTREHAESSTAVMNEARSAMDAISQSSTEISKITSLIEDIAFQTNLLALNAGVEAARAGDAGRGFAVVASEVRALAQRSSEAATQISELIATSADQVGRGVSLVSKTGDSLADIERFVTEVAEMVRNIATGASEQSNGLNEITATIGNLDTVTQKNAAMFEETNAATRMLTQEVDKLGQITASFKIGSDHNPVGGAADRRLAS